MVDGQAPANNQGAKTGEFKVPVYQRSTGQQLNYNKPAYGQPQQQQCQIRDINFELADLYFPLYVIQCRYDIFPLRNRQYRKNEYLHTGAELNADINGN